MSGVLNYWGTQPWTEMDKEADGQDATVSHPHATRNPALDKQSTEPGKSDLESPTLKHIL